MHNKNIKAVTNLIQCLDLESLTNQEVVANLIRAFGIVQWGPAVFGDEEQFKNPYTEMAGIFQTPNQMAKALVYLQQFPLKTYVEIGVFQGGNFLFVSEYLRRFNPEIVCIGIDPTNYLNGEIKDTIDHEPWLSFHAGNSAMLTGQYFDLVFIDGNHENGWVQKDWDNLGQYATICMIHDIQEISCPEIVEFWKDLDKKGKVVKEFLDSTSESPGQGIGILHSVKLKGRV